MKFRRNPQAAEFTVNLTPLIDVVFLLLIFFMVTTSFSQESRLAINLPEADAGSPEQAEPRIDVVVDRDGGYLVNGRRLANNSLATLVSALESEAGGDRDLLVVLAADADARHQAVVTAMLGIERAGLSRLHVATREIR